MHSKQKCLHQRIEWNASLDRVWWNSAHFLHFFIGSVLGLLWFCRPNQTVDQNHPWVWVVRSDRQIHQRKMENIGDSEWGVPHWLSFLEPLWLRVSQWARVPNDQGKSGVGQSPCRLLNTHAVWFWTCWHKKHPCSRSVQHDNIDRWSEWPRGRVRNYGFLCVRFALHTVHVWDLLVKAPHNREPNALTREINREERNHNAYKRTWFMYSRKVAQK